jgi:hypothetical protein
MTPRLTLRGLLPWLWSLDTRSAEIVLAVIVIFRGGALLLPSASMAPLIYAGHLAIMPEWAWGAIELAAGAFALAGILINGRWRRSPWLRVLGATIVGAVFAMLTVTFAFNSPLTVSLAVAIYLPITMAALWSAVNVASKA